MPYVPAAIARDFGNTFDGSVAHDVATAFNCGEIEALAAVLIVLGFPDLADVWIEAHADGDDEGDSHYQPEP